MKAFYPKLIAGFSLFLFIGLLAGGAVGLFIFVATLPMVALFPEPSSAPQVALMIAALAGFVVMGIVVALGTGAWRKRIEADLYRGSAPHYVPAPAPRRPAVPPEQVRYQHPRRVNQR